MGKNDGDWGKEAAGMIAADSEKSRISMIATAERQGAFSRVRGPGTCIRCKKSGGVRAASSPIAIAACQPCIDHAKRAG